MRFSKVLPAGRHASHEPERNVNETHIGVGQSVRGVATERRSPSSDTSSPAVPRVVRKNVPFSFCLIARTKKGCAIVTLSARPSGVLGSPAICTARALRTFLRMHAHSRCVPSLSPFPSPFAHAGASLREVVFFLFFYQHRRHRLPYLPFLILLVLNRHHPPRSVRADLFISQRAGPWAVETWKEADNRIAKET